MRRSLVRIALLGAFILASPVSARSDALVLLGLMTLDGPRPSIGVGFGYCPSIAGFEVEYLGTLGGESADRSSAGGIVGNLIVQPVTIGSFQFFAVGGFGLWGETFADGTGTGALGAKDFGGGVKIRIAERLRLRLDYRLFLLDDPEGASGLPTTTRPQRISAGLHLVF
jgi:hypothetical protein